jgi:hypothetical protein
LTGWRTLRSGVTRILTLVASSHLLASILTTHLLLAVGHVVLLSAAVLDLLLLLVHKQLVHNGDQVGLHEAGLTTILLAELCEVSSVKGLFVVEFSLLLDLVVVDGERAAHELVIVQLILGL